jgi:hypothetical protein
MADTTIRLTRAHARNGPDLTTGNLHGAIWAVAPALMLEMGVLNIAQLLDAYWVGRLGSAAWQR